MKRMRIWLGAGTIAALAVGVVASGVGCTMAQAAPSPAATSLSPADQVLARSILSELIQTDTSHATGSTTTAAEAIRSRLLQAGFAAGDLTIAGPQPNRMNLVVHYPAAPGSTEAPVLFICHLDVVDAKRSDWTLDPYVLTEKDGFFYGRGTQDMKGSDAAVVTSLILLQREHFVPRRELIVAFTADEESGGDNGVEWLLKHRRGLVNAAAAVNPDSGGVLLRNGAPAEMGMEATEKLYADFRLTATSPGGHSSLPRPDNPITEVSEALVRLSQAQFPVELNEVTRAYLIATEERQTPARKALIDRVLATTTDTKAAQILSDEDPRMNALLHTTCVATLVSGGHAVNALPGSATANVNCRILPGHSPAEVLQQLQKIFADPKLEVRYVDVGGVPQTAPTAGAMAPPPLRSDIMTPLRQVTSQTFGQIPVLPTMETGASDSIYTLAAGIPSYGVSGIAIDEGDERAHGRDERIRTSSYFNGVLFQLRFMRTLGSD